jgi:RimJ/RimL family protein N-acetyltransferase
MLDLVRRADAVAPKFRSYFRLVRSGDAEFISTLRSDPALNAHLSPTVASPERQREWIQAYRERESRDEEFYFVIVCDSTDRGVIRMYDFRSIGGRPSFCWGSWILPTPRPAGLAIFSLYALYDLGFETLRFERNHFTAHKANTRAVALYLRTGARIESEDDDTLHFTVDLEEYGRFKERSRNEIASHRRVAVA